MSKRKPNLRDVSRHAPTPEELDALRAALRKEDAQPIVVAILGAAMLEHELEKMVRRRFRRQDDDTWKMMTSENGPLSDLSSKIRAGYAFGLYDDVVMRGLDTARAIRNAFAHSKRLLDFNDEVVASAFTKLTLPKAKRSGYYRTMESLKSGRWRDKGQRAYVTLCNVLLTQLLNRQIRDYRSRRRGHRQRAKLRDALLARSPFYGAFTDIAAVVPQQGQESPWARNALRYYLDQSAGPLTLRDDSSAPPSGAASNEGTNK